MPQDAFTLKYLCEELDGIFSGAKVNRITQPSNDEIIFTMYTGRRTEKLLLNVNPAAPRISVLTSEKESPLTAPNFCMLIRKHLLSATLNSIELVGFDRIVKITFTASGEFKDATEKVLFVELMGRYSNIILTENGKILGGNRGINMFDNGVRPLIVGMPYVFAPVGDKKLPTDDSLIEYFNEFNGENLADYICKGVQGIASTTAQEIVAKYLESGKTILCENFGEDFFEFLKQSLYNPTVNPCVIKSEEKVKDVCLYPYKTVQGELTFFPSLWQAEEFYYSEREREKAYTNKKDRLSSVINAAIKKAKKRLVAITSKEKDALGAEENKIKGELLLANLYRLKNREKSCTLENYYDNSTLTIELDERLTISKNAENYYKKYNKQKRTLVALKPQKEKAEDELNYLFAVADEIALAENIEELSLVQNELESVGLLRQTNSPTKKKTKESFCNVYSVDGFNVRTGRNNAENDKLTHDAKANDLWLHAKDYHSSHVVIESQNKPIPKNVIVIAAEICAYYSKGRESGKAEISYTEKKNVKKPSGAKLGFVTYDNYKSMSVKPEKHTEFLKSE